jgi:hypothetical protein
VGRRDRCRKCLSCLGCNRPRPYVVSDASRDAMGRRKCAKKGGGLGTGNEITIFGRSLSSFACSYSVSMFSPERRKSVGCWTSKRDESDMASTANRCVLRSVSGGGSNYVTNTPLLHGCIIEHAIKLSARHRYRMKPMTPPAPLIS